MFKGSIVALVTPMSGATGPDSRIDWAALERLIEFHIKNGTNAIVSVGTTGESATLSEHEHLQVIRRTVEIVKGRIPVIGGTGANSTIEAVALTRGALEAGADGCLLVTPYYNKPTQEGLFQHFKVVAEAVPIPQILYNVPTRTACDMLPETIGRLSALPNIVGIKEATGDVSRIDRLRELCRKDFDLFSGDDESACEFMLRGGHGVISVTANVVPAAMRRMCDRATSGDKAGAMAEDAKLQGLHKKLFVEANPIPVKWALNRMGMIDKGIRLPLTWLSDRFVADVEAAMRQAEVI
jgi:4-hydroxy-tetrahydrodipicolinate synthase